VFTARYGPSPYITQICFIFKGLMYTCREEYVDSINAITTDSFPEKYSGRSVTNTFQE
jgi:hypothetical protein